MVCRNHKKLTKNKAKGWFAETMETIRSSSGHQLAKRILCYR